MEERNVISMDQWMKAKNESILAETRDELLTTLDEAEAALKNKLRVVESTKARLRSIDLKTTSAESLEIQLKAIRIIEDLLLMR